MYRAGATAVAHDAKLHPIFSTCAFQCSGGWPDGTPTRQPGADPVPCFRLQYWKKGISADNSLSQDDDDRYQARTVIGVMRPGFSIFFGCRPSTLLISWDRTSTSWPRPHGGTMNPYFSFFLPAFLKKGISREKHRPTPGTCPRDAQRPLCLCIKTNYPEKNFHITTTPAAFSDVFYSR